MSSPTPAQFYAHSHLGNRFGVSGPLYGPHGHLGQDFNGWPAGTIIPSWTVGEVVSTGWSDNLGWFITVLAVLSNGPQQSLRYVSFCHMQSRGHALGRIQFGDPVGPIGATGKLAAGVHVHIPVALSKMLGGFDVQDPLPWIDYTVAHTSTAGGNFRPLDDAPAPPQPIYHELEDPMVVFEAKKLPGTPTLKITQDRIYKCRDAQDLQLILGTHKDLDVHDGTGSPLDSNFILASIAQDYGFSDPNTLTLIASMPPGQTLVVDSAGKTVVRGNGNAAPVPSK